MAAAPQHDSKEKRARAVYSSETAGLLFVALLILVVIVIRYWHAIHWSLR